MAAIHDLTAQVAAVVQPMFTDIVMRRHKSDELNVDISVPHQPSRDDNLAEASVRARHAQRHGGHLARPQRRRKLLAARGAERFVRLEMDSPAAIEQASLLSTAAQPDHMFDGVHRCSPRS